MPINRDGGEVIPKEHPKSNLKKIIEMWYIKIRSNKNKYIDRKKKTLFNINQIRTVLVLREDII